MQHWLEQRAAGQSLREDARTVLFNPSSARGSRCKGPSRRDSSGRQLLMVPGARTRHLVQPAVSTRASRTDPVVRPVHDAAQLSGMLMVGYEAWALALKRALKTTSSVTAARAPPFVCAIMISGVAMSVCVRL